ncbi:MAG: hypothetical protein AB7K52_14355 [Phycisphaerales bacterium]
MRGLLERSAAMYSMPLGFEVHGRKISNYRNITSTNIRNAMPQVTEAVPTASPGADLWIESVVRIVSDGGECVRLEKRSLTMGGPPERATTVRIMCGATVIEARELGVDQADRSNISVDASGGPHVASRSADCQRGLATESWGHLCRGTVRALLTSADSMEAPGADAGHMMVYSAAAQIRATILRATGEVVEVDFAWPGDRMFRFYTEGFLEGEVYPARHPQMLASVMTEPGDGLRADSPRAPRDGWFGMVFDHAETLGFADAREFEWTGVAKRLRDRTTGEILDASGRPDAKAMEAAKRRESAVPIRRTDDELVAGQIPKAASRRDPLSVAIIAAGVMCLVLALFVWLRRRAV